MGAEMNRMIKSVSFDLDGTLILGGVQNEPMRWWGALIGAERLRKGTVELFRSLNAHRISVSIYTTSLRPRGQIRRTIAAHGLSVDQIVTGSDSLLKDGLGMTGKRPCTFGFDAHVDDAISESESGALDTLIIQVMPDDED